MPREPRIIVAGGTYHIFARGNNKQSIFHDNVDRYRYLQMMAKAVRLFEVRLFAYVLMSNHVHLVFQATAANIAEAMHRVHCPYAVQFNRRHGHVGHAFSGRYKSRPILEDVDLLGLTSYIYLNPVRAGLVQHPQDYPWSSYLQYTHPEGSAQLVDPTPILSQLATEPTKRRIAYEKFALAELARVLGESDRS